MFSTLLEVFSQDVLRIGLSAYGDLLAEYRGLFRIAVALWALGISFEALTSENSFRPTVIKFLRGAVVIAYLTEPAVPKAFAQLLQVPAETSGVVVGHVTDGQTAGGNFGQSLDDLYIAVNEKVAALYLDSFQDPNTLVIALMFAKLVVLFVFLTAFLAVVLYVSALATFFQAALLFVLPFAVTLYPWSYTRPLFDGVIRQGLSFSLVIPLLHALVAMVIPSLLRMLAHGVSLFALVPFCCLATIGSLLALQIPAVAAGVAGGVGLPLPRLR